ncbi:bifunctional phosphopantothenoylcysteine decarboxylase/phosphopantothenate--cysteine ligase CoaBC [Thermogladius sp. 4427co]|uniref:bifunctional phosphopantothenoylcysteine decarboxylase/phosphopantothenate--cysteine ligase CoaBC n=1 Tax=Thermogladius sp. 4427co TaxID=3450718 RepID=UPI003F7A13E6
MSLVEELKLRETTPLKGKNIVLGLTASSAIYRSIDLARELIRMGASVRVIMTKASTKLIGLDLVYWATGRKPLVETSGKTEHIDLAKWGDLMVIAPATLNTMGKIANGVVDELLHLTAVTMMGDGKKVIFVPAMNIRLYNSPQYKKIEETLESYGGIIIKPLIEEDRAKYPPLSDLAHCIDSIANRGLDLLGKRVLVTAGATLERIDPIRVITNPSSGLMGVLIAREASCRGAVVDLVHGKMSVNPPYNVSQYKVVSTEEMASTVRKLTRDKTYDIALFAAAPADFRPVEVSDAKIPTSETSRLVVELTPTEKVIKSFTQKPRIVVAFAAETYSGDQLVERAVAKMHEYNADMVVAHDATAKGAGFGEAYLDAVIVTRTGIERLGLVHKYILARRILDSALAFLKT